MTGVTLHSHVRYKERKSEITSPQDGLHRDSATNPYVDKPWEPVEGHTQGHRVAPTDLLTEFLNLRTTAVQK